MSIGLRELKKYECMSDNFLDSRLQRFRQEPPPGKSSFLVAELGGEQVAFLCIREDDWFPGALVLEEIQVKMGIREKQIGSNVMCELEVWAKGCGADWLILDPLPLDEDVDLARLESFYLKLGYRKGAYSNGDTWWAKRVDDGVS